MGAFHFPGFFAQYGVFASREAGIANSAIRMVLLGKSHVGTLNGWNSIMQVSLKEMLEEGRRNLAEVLSTQ
jgi:hypothetical protein